MSKAIVHSIIDALGPEAIERVLQISKHSVRAARRDGRFPARWYAPLRALCDEQGVDCPMAAFHWLDADKKTGSAA